MHRRTAHQSLTLLSLLAVFGVVALVAAFGPASAAGPATNLTKPAPTLPTPTVQPQPFMHTVSVGEGLPAVARRYLPRTPYMTVAELEDALARANHLDTHSRLHPGEQLLIPEYEYQLPVEHLVAEPRNYEVRAIYLTGLMAGSPHGLRIVRQWQALGGNSVVFDIKDSDGLLSIAFDDPLASHSRHPYISSLPKFIHFLHSLNLHAIARIAIFRDQHVATTHSELAVQSRRALAAAGGKGVHPWLEHGKQVWTDPSNPAVQDYNLALAKYVAESGADEIQFDYVRFPAESDQADARFAFMSARAACGKPAVANPSSAPGESSPASAGTAKTENPAACAGPRTRADVIAGFLQRAYTEIHPTGALLSLDVFGVMAWARPVDLAHTGQDIARMAKWCDVISPMIYPSHFFGMEGYAHPGDAPEHFISESLQRFLAVTKGSGVVIRPWLQAFAWRTKTYSTQYIETQVKVARANGGIGFLFWNARNDYGRPFAAMPVMTAGAGEYFGVPKPAAAAPASGAPAPAAGLATVR